MRAKIELRVEGIVWGVAMSFKPYERLLRSCYRYSIINFLESGEFYGKAQVRVKK